MTATPSESKWDARSAEGSAFRLVAMSARSLEEQWAPASVLAMASAMVAASVLAMAPAMVAASEATLAAHPPPRSTRQPHYLGHRSCSPGNHRWSCRRTSAPLPRLQRAGRNWWRNKPCLRQKYKSSQIRCSQSSLCNKWERCENIQEKGIESGTVGKKAPLLIKMG